MNEQQKMLSTFLKHFVKSFYNSISFVDVLLYLFAAKVDVIEFLHLEPYY